MPYMTHPVTMILYFYFMADQNIPRILHFMKIQFAYQVCFVFTRKNKNLKLPNSKASFRPEKKIHLANFYLFASPYFEQNWLIPDSKLLHIVSIKVRVTSC